MTPLTVNKMLSIEGMASSMTRGPAVTVALIPTPGVSEERIAADPAAALAEGASRVPIEVSTRSALCFLGGLKSVR
jgi:hypothetical protein